MLNLVIIADVENPPFQTNLFFWQGGDFCSVCFRIILDRVLSLNGPFDCLMSKLSLKKNGSNTIYPINGKDKEIYLFLKGISPKVNVIA